MFTLLPYFSRPYLFFLRHVEGPFFPLRSSLSFGRRICCVDHVFVIETFLRFLSPSRLPRQIRIASPFFESTDFSVEGWAHFPTKMMFPPPLFPYCGSPFFFYFRRTDEYFFFFPRRRGPFFKRLFFFLAGKDADFPTFLFPISEQKGWIPFSKGKTRKRQSLLCRDEPSFLPLVSDTVFDFLWINHLLFFLLLRVGELFFLFFLWP